MAYTEKYFVAFCNPLGQSCRVSIKQDGFVGVPTELVGQEDPFVVAYDNSDDFKFKAIIESEASINLVFNDDTLSFSELWTSNERTFKVESTIEGVLDWTGFIIPEGFDYNLKGGSYEAVLIARDGLATLEGILFKTEDNQFYGFQDFGFNDGEMYPFILVLTEILRKLDLGIDIWTLVDYYEQTMLNLNVDSRESDPLALSFVNVKTYINDTDRTDIAYFEDVNEAWDCQKIIENICNIWGSRLYQENGVWKFKSIHADSVIASSYTTDSDVFVGVNPNQIGAFVWEYETFYSLTRDITLDTTVLFYGNFNGAAINDKIYSDALLTTPSIAGFYLIKGLDKLLEVNAIGVVVQITNYEPVVSDYYWKKYNNTAGYLGRELAKTEVVIPCSNKDVFLKDNDALVRMDKVYKQFRVNYDYTFVRVGDSPINLLQNGNFALPFTQYGQLEAPPNWERWRVWSDKWFPRGRVNTLSDADKFDTEGNTHALETQIQYGGANTPNTDPYSAIWAAFLQSNIIIDQKVKALNFDGWVKYRYREVGGDRFTFYPVFRAVLFPSPPIVTGGMIEAYVLENVISEDFDLGWRKIDIRLISSGDIAETIRLTPIYNFFITQPQDGSQWVESEQSDTKWYDFNMKVQMPPKFGTIDFYIHGLCSIHGKKSKSYPAFTAKIQSGTEMVDYGYPVALNPTAPRPQFTGLNLGYVPNPDTEVPKTDYIYANGDINYTFQDDPIRIYNGDTVDPEIVSGILVPTNLSGLKNKWDTFNNAFGKSDIGMILCKSIMQQYYKPNRLLDCEFKSVNYKYGDVIAFEHIPDVKFIMLRGSFNSKRGYWEGCTLAQISSDNISPGGIVNGDTLDPIWQETGNTRCVKDINGENTGESEYETQDINSNSDSFGDFRWQSSGENLTMCPIGEPSKFYWGTDIELYDTDNFTDYTISYEDDSIGEVQLSYDNIGGNYIYFLHLASLGSVVQVSNQYQSQIISSFTYLADVTINGYLYRVLRQNFVTSAFDNFLLTYYIQ
jgi:hypothetical protein